MADTFTPSLNLCKPEINQSAQTWGIKLNSDLDLIDAHAAAMKSFQAANDARINALIAAAFPRGCIIAWSGGAGSVPAGWLLCNGTNGTPNLTDRFILGNTGNRANWEAGGSFNSGNAVTDTQGYHGHGGGIAAHSLTWNQMPGHVHAAWTDTQGDHTHPMNALQSSNPPGMAYGGGMGIVGSFNTGVAGAHAHNVGIGNAGNNEPHTHGLTIDGAGAHAHNVSVTVVPPYFSLAYIMRA